MRHSNLRTLLILAVAALAAGLVLACNGGDGSTGSVSDPGSSGGSVSDTGGSGTPGGTGPTGSGDEIYVPVSGVDGHLAIALDARDIAALLEASPVDYAAVAQIYSAGKNSKNSDGSFRTLKGFATDAERAEEFADAVAFFGSPTFLDDDVSAAIDGTGEAAGWSDAQRKQAINKGVLRILYHWVRHEMHGAQDKLAAGEVDPADGAPHNWDEAWAFYAGAADETGARPYALAGTALKREDNYAKQGLIDQPLREALADGLEAIEAADESALADAIERVESRLNAIFYLSTARYFQNAFEAASAGDTEEVSIALIEGLSFYRTIQPMVAAADPNADELISAFFSRPADSPFTLEERDEALAALNRSQVASALALEVTDLLSPASYG